VVHRVVAHPWAHSQLFEQYIRLFLHHLSQLITIKFAAAARAGLASLVVAVLGMLLMHRAQAHLEQLRCLSFAASYIHEVQYTLA
jgi:hypothetical protein